MTGSEDWQEQELGSLGSLTPRLEEVARLPLLLRLQRSARALLSETHRPAARLDDHSSSWHGPPYDLMRSCADLAELEHLVDAPVLELLGREPFLSAPFH